ncbi:hypothetical protein MASR2M66_00280 [Chloroflexota bacterium]
MTGTLESAQSTPAPQKDNPAIPVTAPTPAAPDVAPKPIPTPAVAAAETSQTVKIIDALDDKDDSPGGLGRSLQPEVKPHAFVVMPFGKKVGPDGHPFDFNSIYNTLIKPAIEIAGFEPFRADEETASGDILTDMFQELLLADMVICDLSIDNANAFYEVGIRHALRKRGVVHIQAGRAYMPFDIFNVRTLPYHITPEGVPDPEHIRNDIKAIARLVKDTWATDRDAVHSPIYNLLSGLNEPGRKSLRTPLATGFWREYDEWRDRVIIAQREKHIGDILLLTEEIKNPLIREEAVAEVGKALAMLGRNELALAQYRKGIQVNSSNLEFRREEAFHLNRVGRVNEAILKLEGILKEYPKDTKTISYLGRIYKEMWINSWIKIRNEDKRLRQAFASYHWLIQSIDTYMKGFQVDLRDYYPGINALTLSHLAIHLANKFDSRKKPDPDITRIRKRIPGLQSTLQFTLESQIGFEQDKVDYWILASLAELRLLTSNDKAEVTRSYRKAVTALRRDLFSLRSSLQQLEIIKALGFRTEFASACIKLTKEEIKYASTGDGGNLSADRSAGKKGRRALLFTGYMVDYSGKDKKIFPPEKEADIRSEIRKRIEKFKPQLHDRAFLSGLSAGSEMIFAEECIAAGIKLKIFLPQSDSAYVRKFVTPAGESWVDRFYKVRNHPLVDEIYQTEHLGPPKDGDNLYERNCRWTVYSAIGRVGIDNIFMIAVASEYVGDTRDKDILLTRYIIEVIRNFGGRVEELVNPTKYITKVINKALDELILENKPSEKKKFTAVQPAIKETGK